MRGLGAVFGLLSKLTPGNADDPICLSSSDDEAPPPRPTPQSQRRPSTLASKAKGKQKVADEGYASDASQTSDISISDILNSSQNVHANSKSKSGTPKVGLPVHKPSSSPVKGSVDLTGDSDDDPRSRAAPTGGPTSTQKPSSSQTPTQKPRTPSAQPSKPKYPGSDPKQRKLSAMFKDTHGAGSWSNPTPLIPDKRPKPQEKETPKAPAGPPPGSWGNPEPLVINPPSQRKRGKEDSVASDAEQTPSKPPSKRPKVAKTTARKSVGGRRMMAALAAQRSASAGSTSPSRDKPASPAAPAAPASAAAASPARAGPSWNTQPDPSPTQPSRESPAASARGTPQSEADYEAPALADLADTEMAPQSPLLPEGDDTAPASEPVALADLLEPDDEDSSGAGDGDLQLPSLVPFASQQGGADSTAASGLASETAAAQSPSPPPAAQRSAATQPDDAAQSSPPPPPASAAGRTPTPPLAGEVAVSMDIEMDESGSDGSHGKLDDEDSGFQLPGLLPHKENNSSTSEEGDAVRLPDLKPHEGNDSSTSEDGDVTQLPALQPHKGNDSSTSEEGDVVQLPTLRPHKEHDSSTSEEGDVVQLPTLRPHKGDDSLISEDGDVLQLPTLRPHKENHSSTSEDGDVIRTPEDGGEESEDDSVIRPVIEVPPGDTDAYINNVLNPERDIEVILGPDPPKEPTVVIPFGGQAVPVSSAPRSVEQPPDELRGKARREVGDEITEYNLTMRNLTSNPELQCEVFAGYIGQATAHDEPFAPEIRVVNKVDQPGKPPAFEFVYSNEMLYHKGVPDPELGTGCDCEGPCDPNSTTCSCVKRQELYFYNLSGLSGFAYDENERVKNTGCAIWECSETCGCPPECLNRVISRGRKVPVELFKTPYKGWGVRAKTDIPRGQFIGVYAGEMIPDAEAESCGIEYEKIGRTYLFDLDGWHMSNPPEGLQFVDERLHKTAMATKRRAKQADRERGLVSSDGLLSGTYSAYSVDAFHTGNFTRFINHSCDPNLSTTQAYFKDFHPERPCLVIVARRYIRQGEELCISYKGEPEDEPDNWAVPLDPVNSRKQSKTSAKAHFSPKKVSAKDDYCRCGAYNCDGKMFG